MALSKKKLHDHNGKEIKPQTGKNVRLTRSGHQIITQYCRDRMLIMGAFVEKCTLDKIPDSYKPLPKK